MKKHAERSLNELRDEMRAVARGARKAPPIAPTAVLPLFSPGNIEMLEAIGMHQPDSISELATALGRAQSNVSRALQALIRHGLVRLEREEGKRTLRPVLVARFLKVDLRTGAYEVE